jgi:hypothetical protein
VRWFVIVVGFMAVGVPSGSRAQSPAATSIKPLDAKLGAELSAITGFRELADGRVDRAKRCSLRRWHLLPGTELNLLSQRLFGAKVLRQQHVLAERRQEV